MRSDTISNSKSLTSQSKAQNFQRRIKGCGLRGPNRAYLLILYFRRIQTALHSTYARTKLLPNARGIPLPRFSPVESFQVKGVRHSPASAKGTFTSTPSYQTGSLRSYPKGIRVRTYPVSFDQSEKCVVDAKVGALGFISPPTIDGLQATEGSSVACKCYVAAIHRRQQADRSLGERTRYCDRISATPPITSF